MHFAGRAPLPRVVAYVGVAAIALIVASIALPTVVSAGLWAVGSMLVPAMKLSAALFVLALLGGLGWQLLDWWRSRSG